MAKLKTLLLVLAGFILVACGTDEKKTAVIHVLKIRKGYLKQEAANFNQDLD